MSEFLDELARSLTTAMPRRKAVRVVGGALLGLAIPAARATAAPATHDCPAQNAFLCQCPSINGLFYKICCPNPTPTVKYECQCKAPPGGHAACHPVVSKRDCQGPSNNIKSVKTASGRDYGLTNTSFRPGQRVTASEAMQLQLGDGSVLKLDKGTSFDIDKCPFDESTVIDLLTGKLWNAAKRAAGAPEFQVETERAVTGPRGTTYWISYLPARKRTTVHVVKGSVEFRQRFGAKRRLLVKSGQTAVQEGNGPPRITKR